ncbi:type IV toxin-antitoxin system AbiEi family antitoxin domain-containing protein [Stutzerimonas stutzeri]|uniref:type IV toxin-antitoxin system AbiEi family antitoxin domain-containing protein n=1 Tax=Stutzerimonas stutzeri TaxID=316 RepID=UPI00210CE012|nr:hypothetical protein [Stutzerimonas stutzeri]MCQ4240346.1 hypothetical protein [Stutzerimonas stutzeri]
MNSLRVLRPLGSAPVLHSTLVSLLKHYKTPNNKIARWLDEGVLLSVKRGVYVVAPQVSGAPVERMIVANLLYGPSYVSTDYALWHYGLIPEQVAEVTSVTTLRSKIIQGGLGRFSYQRMPDALYPIGIDSVMLGGGLYGLLAVPAKALCDRLVLTRNLRVHSVASMQRLLIEDLRFDTDEASMIDLQVIDACAATGHKTELLEHLKGAIAQWQ